MTELRSHVRNKLLKILLDLNENTDDNIKRMKNTEIAIFNYSIIESKKKHNIANWDDMNFRNIYKTKAMNILSNIDPNSYVGNNVLIHRYLNNEFDHVKLINMKPQEMFPERWEQAYHELKKIQNLNIQKEQKVYNSILKCGKCKKNMVRYTEIQTRSADEPTTKICQCTNCGNKWKFC